MGRGWPLVLAALIGCDDDAGATASAGGAGAGGDSPCALGERLGDEGCIPAGAPETPCPPGEWGPAELGSSQCCPAGTTPLDDGVCQPAGIAVGACAAGFGWRDGGCEPVLPDVSCPSGELAVPGELLCRSVANCGAAPWGDIPVEPDTVYVDAGYLGSTPDGSAADPYPTLQAGIDAAPEGAMVAIAEGSYATALVTKELQLWGRCPTAVTVDGILIQTGASGSELHDLGVDGALGVSVIGVEDVLLERLWIHPDGVVGVSLNGTDSDAEATLRGSLIEGAGYYGAVAYGSSLLVESSVVRAIAVRDASGASAGVAVRGESGRGQVTMRGSVIEGVVGLGLLAEGGKLEVEASVIRDNQAVTALGLYGHGIALQPNAAGEQATLELDTSVVERNVHHGLYLLGGDTQVTATVVRETTPSVPEGVANGVTVQRYEYEGVVLPASAALDGCLVERNQRSGVFVGAATLAMTATLVRHDEDFAGYGLEARPVGANPAELGVIGSAFERSHGAAVFLDGADATLIGTALRDTLLFDDEAIGLLASQFLPGSPRPRVELSACRIDHAAPFGILAAGADLVIDRSFIGDIAAGAITFARGVQIQPSQEGAPGTLALTASAIERVAGYGVLVSGSQATISATTVRDISSNEAGLHGDGVAVVSETAPAGAELLDVRIERSQRAGVAVFGATLSLSSSALACNQLDLDVEPYAGLTPTVSDAGQNGCGCPTPNQTCKAVSAGITPPSFAR